MLQIITKIAILFLSPADTSGSLNLNVCTPLSGKDFTREFTSRIHERCQLPVQGQQTTTVLDPGSGKISTVLTKPVSVEISSPQSSPAKKPSYLNLACCVNGYSNLTTYDSKFRQSINRSREVSPIRPITHTIQYNRGDSHLSVPVSFVVNDSSKNGSMMDAHSLLSPEKRFFMQSQTAAARDCTDNASSNGCATFFKKTVIHSSKSSHSSSHTTITKDGDNETKKSSKSFIQQRVERLYGPTALAQGLYSPKKPKSVTENILVEKSQNSSKFNGHTTTTTSTNAFVSTNGAAIDTENVQLAEMNEALPVLKHLRPEFRAQLPMMSPKRSIGLVKPATTPSPPPKVTTNGTVNGKSSGGERQIHVRIEQSDAKVANGSGANGDTVTAIARQSTHAKCDETENSLTSTSADSAHGGKHQHDRRTTTSAASASGQVDTETIESVAKLRLDAEEPSHCGTFDKMPTTSKRIARESDANGNHKTETTKDALYFLKTVHAERDRLIQMADKADSELDDLLKVRASICGDIR